MSYPVVFVLVELIKRSVEQQNRIANKWAICWLSSFCPKGLLWRLAHYIFDEAQ